MNIKVSAVTFRMILYISLTLTGIGLSYLLLAAPPRVDASRPLQPLPAPYYLYFPFVPKQTDGIYGRVTQNGVPAANIVLSMRYFDGVSSSTIATTTTDADGYYHFRNIPSLTGTKKDYHVRYQNPGPDLDRLWSWSTRVITSYVGGTDVAIGNFDLANISLVDPAPSSTIALPYRFQWTPRPATPTDSYEVDFFDPVDRNPWVWTNPPLGYVNSTVISSIDSSFSSGVWYGWDVWVYGPDGGYGESHYYNPVQFANIPASAASASPAMHPFFESVDQAPRDLELPAPPEHAAR